MSETLTAFTTRVNNLHSAPVTVVTSAKVTQAIEDALAQYTDELPLEVSVALPSSSTGVYTLTDTVAGWDETHQLLNVMEYSAGDFTPLDSNGWQVYELAGTYTLRIRAGTESTTLYLVYTYPHTLTAGATTIRARDLNPLAYLAASICCTMAAAATSDKKSSTVAGSSVDLGSIPTKWLEMADKFKDRWDAHLVKFQESGGGWAEWDFRGENFPIQHSRTWH